MLPGFLSMLLFLAVVKLTHAMKGTPWGNFDGNGGLRDGHYCADNSLSPPTDYNFSAGYWAGLTWAATNPAPGVYNWTEVDALLRTADASDQFVEFNALVGQCSPTWLYTNGITALNVNWKPPPSCVPPTCVPAGTWSCGATGASCGCDGVFPCNQTFPDYLSPVYLKYAQEWIRATHAHFISLPENLLKRILSVQVNAGSTGDGCFFHGRLYPDQQMLNSTSHPPCYTCQRLGKTGWKDYYHTYYMEIATTYVETYATVKPISTSAPVPPTPPGPGPKPAPGAASKKIQLLFNGFAKNDDLVALVKASSLYEDGFMIKDGLVSHSYSVSGEMSVWNTSRVYLQTELPGGKGKYVRARGESTLTAFIDWVLQPHWTAWAMAANAAAYGLDTWQNNTLMEDVPAMRPALSFFTKYAGSRKAPDSPGAWAVMRDGLDVSDIVRFPEETFGKVDKGKNLDRCFKVIAAISKTQTVYPPRLDAPSNSSCGTSRKRGGLNDAGYQLCPGNYNNFLEQIDADTTSYGAWRAGPKDEIFGRYGRSTSKGMAFKVVGGVFDTHTSSAVYARVVFLRTKRSASSSSADFVVSYSTTSSDAGSGSKCTSKKISSAKDEEEHWVEVQFPIATMVGSGGHFGGGGCDNGADVVIAQPRAEAERIVFNLLEISKENFTFRMTKWSA